MREREFEHLSNVDYVPTNTHSSQGESQLYIFEDKEAVINMIIKGRSPTMRHVSRTHRVALDWLFDRISSAPKIQIKYVDTKKPTGWKGKLMCWIILIPFPQTSSPRVKKLSCMWGTKNQLADMLTKERFSRDEWNPLLRLFNIMNFSMFSCSHLNKFLSDSIGKQSALSKRCQDATSSSPMSKPKPTVPAKTRPLNLVLDSPWSAIENPSQDLGFPVNLVNDGKGQDDLTRTRKPVQTTQNPEVERSQVKRQEIAQSSDSLKQYNQEEASHSTSTRKLVQTATPRTECQNMKFTNHQYMTKIFHFLQEKLGITEAYSTFSMAALKTNVLIWWMFMTWSMKAVIRFGPNNLPSLEVYKDTNFEEIHNSFNITQKLILEHSEENLNSNSIDNASPSWTRSVLSHDQVIQWEKAKVLVYSDSSLCLGKMYENKDAIKRWWGQVEEFNMSPSYKELLGIDGEVIEFEWDIFLGFSTLQIFQKPRWFEREEHRTGKIHRLDHLHVKVQRHRLDKEKKWWNLYFEFRKSRGLREEILARTLDVSGSWTGKEVVWNSSSHTRGKLGFHNQSDGGTIQRHRSSSIQEYQCFES